MVSAPGLIGILAGPTATGKSELGLRLAEEAGCPIEIISADSLLVYRGMDIGTAKPTPAERAQRPHHLLDLRDPSESYTAADFVRDTRRIIGEIEARGARPLIVGGTGFYLKALLHGTWDAPPTNVELRERLAELDADSLYRELEAADSVSALRIGRNDRYRLVRAVEILRLTGRTPSELQAAQIRPPDPRFRLWIIDRPDQELEERIAARASAMLANGLLEETRALVAAFPGARALAAVGYAQARIFLDGGRPPGRKPRAGEPGLLDEIGLATRQLVKSQRTWFRGQHSENERAWFTLDAELPTLRGVFLSVYSSAPGPNLH